MMVMTAIVINIVVVKIASSFSRRLHYFLYSKPQWPTSPNQYDLAVQLCFEQYTDIPSAKTFHVED